MSTTKVFAVFGENSSAGRAFGSVVRAEDYSSAMIHVYASSYADGLDCDHMFVVEFDDETDEDVVGFVDDPTVRRVVVALWRAWPEKFGQYMPQAQFLETMNHVATFIRSIVSTDVESSAIRRVEYNRAASSMCITFKNGAKYVYYNVPIKVYNELIAAESVGKCFNDSVRGRYDYELAA